MKRGPQEAVQDYCARFNNVYTAIPQNLKPPPNLSLIKFPDGFDPDMAYQLRERALASLEDMQSIAISVEANLISKRARARAKRRTNFKEEPSAFEQKFDATIKGMDRLGDQVETIERKSSSEGQAANTTRNPNFRRNQNLNSGKTSLDQNIRKPFQENYAEASTSNEPTVDIQINLMGLNVEQQIVLTQDDQETHNFNQFQTKSGESFDFREGYDALVYEVHKQYKLRSRTIDVLEPSKMKDTKQPKKMKDKAALTEPPLETDLNTKQPIIEDISDLQPLKNYPSASIPSK